MSKDSKRTFFTFLPYECAAAEEYLELMAEKGWLLQSIKGKFFKFKKIEPKKIKYSVDVFDKVSIYDHKDSDAALEYREYCKAAGWNYVCEIGKIQVFYSSDDKKAISIHTDEEEKFKLVFKASLNNVGSKIFLIIMLIFNICIPFILGDGGTTLASNFGIFSIVIGVSFIIINSIGFISFLLWVIKTKGQLKKGKFMNYNNYKQIKKQNVLKKCYGLIILIILLKLLNFDYHYNRGYNIPYLIVVCIPIIIIICAQKLIDKKRYSKDINISINIGSVIVSVYLVLVLTLGYVLLGSNKTLPNDVLIQEVNLITEDFGFIGNNNDENHYINFNKSIIAQKIEYSSGNNDNYLQYTILQSDYPLLINFYENRLLKRLNSYIINLKQENTNLPNNIVVYSDSDKRTFVLVSEDKVVEIRKDFTNRTEEEFLNVVYKKLFY